MEVGDKRMASKTRLGVITALILAHAANAAQAGKSPVKVFILAGQSNMQGHGIVKVDSQKNEGRGTLEYLVKNPNTAQRYAHLVDDKGRDRKSVV